MQHSTSSSPLPPDHFEKIRRNAAEVQRINNVDVITTAQNETYAFCHIPYFYSFSFFPESKEPRTPFDVGASFEGAAAIHLAMTHLNTGNGAVIPEVAGLNERCNIRFTMEIFDTDNWETTTVKHTIDVLEREEPTREESLPCAFLGASRSAVTMAMSIITSVSGYPQMSGISTSSRLDDRTQYKHFSRLIPSDDGTAIAVVLYLRDVVQTDHLAVLHANAPYMNEYIESLQRAQTVYAPTMSIESIDIPFNLVSKKDIETAVTFLKNTQYRYIFAIIDGLTHYDRLLTEAHRQGITGDDYVWMYSDSLFEATIINREYEPDSPLAEAARGACMLTVQPGLPGEEEFENFLEAFHGLNATEVIAFLQSKGPVYPGEEDFVPLQVKDIFGAPDPGINAIYLYDSMIAIGLAACAVADPVEYFDGPTHFAGILKTNFTGASGPIKIDPNTGSRVFSSAYFQLTNFQERKNPASGKVYFDAVQTNLFQDGVWTSLRRYKYGDGTSKIPHSLPVVDIDYNYISRGLRGTGFALSALTMTLSIAFAAWTIRHRKSKVVRASQPIFLLFTSTGVFLMGSAIIPLSFDDKIASQQGCDIACMVTPWLFILGFAVAFAALFSKTWRINRLFHHHALRRITVTPHDVMMPLVLLLFVDVFVLALWTGLSPLKWVREITSVDVFGQVVETEGHCYSGTEWIPFVVVLCVFNIAALILAAYQAYYARNIGVEFAESVHIGRAIGLFLLACLYGIPVLAITWGDANARYFVLMVIIFVCSMAVLLFIFVPKVRYHRRGSFQRASQLVREHSHATGRSRSVPMAVNAYGLYVSGVPRRYSDAGENFGVRVVDTPAIRASLQERNTDLQEENETLREQNSGLIEEQKMLQEHVKLLEGHEEQSVLREDESSTLTDHSFEGTKDETAVDVDTCARQVAFRTPSTDENGEKENTNGIQTDAEDEASK